MIRFSVLYPNQEGKRFDWEYYLNKHVPMVRQKLGDKCKDVFVDAGIKNEVNGQEAQYVAMFHIMCASIEKFQEGLMPHAQEIFDDIQNYTDIEPITQLNKVKL